MKSVSCWMDGLWSDALGEMGTERSSGIKQRCDRLLREVDFVSREVVDASEERVPPLESGEVWRALEPRVVEAVARTMEARAAGDRAMGPHTQELLLVLRATADTARETVHARWAADRVKHDVSETAGADARADDKRTADVSLRGSDGLERLAALEVGPFTREAHAMALLFALDRLEIARDLPEDRKVDWGGAALREVFGVPVPAVRADPAARSGAWLEYLTRAAAAARHSVPEDAHAPQNREPLAWSGVLEGFADRLRDEASRPECPPRLANIARGLVARLNRQYQDQRAAYLAYPPAER